MQKNVLAVVFFILFLAMIPAAGYTVLHFGICKPNAPCLIPVWFAPMVYAPSGVLFAGLAFVLRDILQRLSSVIVSVVAVICGTIISYSQVDPTLALAGCSAYFLSEIIDTVVYSNLQKYNLILAVLTSSCFGLLVDSLVFLHLAFHSYQLLPGQIIGKLLMVLLSIPLIKLGREYIN